MIKKIAAIGDLHGCIDEFKQLYNQLCWISLDEIWTVGDLVDRGPDSAGVVQFCIDNGIKSVMGNHDQSILNHYKRTIIDNGPNPKNLDKSETLKQLTPSHIAYIEKLPKLHVIDDLNLVLVHGGLLPKLPLYAQPDSVIRLQMIHPDMPGKIRWWGSAANQHASGKTEEENKAEGYVRWYSIYDGREDVVFGHSCFAQPMIYQQDGLGTCIGIDTGSCFGGSVTALIHDGTPEYSFMSIKAKKVYCKNTTRSFWEV